MVEKFCLFSGSKVKIIVFVPSTVTITVSQKITFKKCEVVHVTQNRVINI